ncbi:hypothetical protein [Runella sp. SP2]|uniref:hypothetical protein n=1 Tax=Runella sp. SP2 TaxID=2268026 RepID=UPI0019805858|nr:hypothetical protein [Runella sp. SP2]
MKINNNSFWVGFLLLAMTNCTPPPDKIGTLDLKKWRSDRGGCEGIRKNQLGDFKKIEAQLLKKHIDEVGQLLGRPDIHQLAGRDQKFYVYFFEKGPHCNDITKKSEGPKVILRFNAIGYLAEVTHQTKPL